MANTKASLKTHEGKRNVHYIITGYLDGSGDVNQWKCVDVSALADTVTTNFAIRRIKYTCNTPVQLLWDATAPVVIANIYGHDTLDFDAFGGIPNKGGSGSTGSILLSTLGGSAGNTFTIVIEGIKKAPPNNATLA